MLMMRPPPCFFRCGTASRDMRAKKRSERCTAVAHCSSVALWARASGGPPELLTRMSRRPKRSTVFAISSLIVSCRSRSPANTSTSRPVAPRISCAAFSRSSRERLHTATRAPSSASTCAHARPSPLLAPPTIATLSLSSRSMRHSGLLKAAVPLDLHERLDAGAEGRPAARNGGGLDGLEQLALGRAVLDGAPHVGDDSVLAAAIGQDADDHHLAVLDRELLALAHRQGAQRPPRLDVLGIFLRDPVPERVAVRAGGLAFDLAGELLRASAHRGLLVSFIGTGPAGNSPEGITRLR